MLGADKGEVNAGMGCYALRGFCYTLGRAGASTRKHHLRAWGFLS
jgi:hypothetical protein